MDENRDNNIRAITLAKHSAREYKNKNKDRKGKIRNKRRKRRQYLLLLAATVSIGAVLSVTAVFRLFFTKGQQEEQITPGDLLTAYMAYIQERDYASMYRMLDVGASGGLSQEEFKERNAAIYEGIDARNIKIEITGDTYDRGDHIVWYKTELDTIAGPISFDNEAVFTENEDGHWLVWDDDLIFPGLRRSDKVRILTAQAKRGKITDRNGRMLAGEGTASSVGIVPGKLEDKKNSIKEIAGLLGMKPKQIKKKLAAGWVKEDSFVPVKTVRKVEELELMTPEPDAGVLAEYERQQRLLEIPGVMLSDTEVRRYPLGDAAAHLIGYVQGVTAEDLEEHTGEGYTSNSVIGRSGIEGLFESTLKGQDGCRIFIVDSKGREKKVLAYQMPEHGHDIKLTIDAELQSALYEQFREDKSCSVAMDPYTGEVLALVSTPSYDDNDLILGISDQEWARLQDDGAKPMYNRFRQAWCPGSTFKPITAAVGLESGAVDPMEDYGNVGLSWQKDTSWGDYYVTTLHAYEPVVLENALIYSDNIYFAKAALKIGVREMEESLERLGFRSEMPFDIRMADSQYSNSGSIDTEVQLADSGYGQGEMLVNPLHLACIYTAFCNDGNIVKPSLLYQTKAEPEFWIEGAFSRDTADTVLDGIKKVVNDPEGTGYRAHREDVVLAGKTGTAEIKASQDDSSGTELGWFVVFTPEASVRRPIMIVSMTEDVKGRGGSGYVVDKDSQVMEQWFGSEE